MSAEKSSATGSPEASVGQALPDVPCLSVIPAQAGNQSSGRAADVTRKLGARLRGHDGRRGCLLSHVVPDAPAARVWHEPRVAIIGAREDSGLTFSSDLTGKSAAP